ncbi:hypothetical protein LSCM1_00621 [Leishmania martiniquensis]|uniref:Paraflagellar rod component n=1 Tax=Leishmania martiniquensis TaxID=1580590 RepID=A0A836K632_9TRYP|nr:hypothetical protein LSCM1_00621 [Leishmania martiniquensis]
MESVQQSIAPLSPFSWVPEEKATRPGSANVVLHDIARLDLRFELVLAEFAVPFNHPVHRIYADHPLLHTTMSLRQLQLLQYGVVVHPEEQLVMVAVSPSCGDSGACIAASYEQVFAHAMESHVANHSLLPEYTFIVYRLPAAPTDDHVPGGEAPAALFRLVFRNVSAEEETGNANTSASARFKLVAVLTSSAAYYAELQRGIHYHTEWRTHTASTRACNPLLSAASSLSVSAPYSSPTVVPEAVAREWRASSPLSQLCTCFAHVLERFNPEGTAADFAGAVCANVTNGDGAEAVCGSVAPEPSGIQARDPWTFYYTREGLRLRRRIGVIQSTPAILSAWRDGEMDLSEFQVTRMKAADMSQACVDPHKSTHPLLSLERRNVPCARLLLLPTHRELSTFLVGNEVSSFLPRGEVHDEAGNKSWGVVYANAGAERLRRWVLKGLVCAEAHEVHAVLLNVDPVELLTPCVELLFEEDDDEYVGCAEGERRLNEACGASEAQLRYRHALFLVCQVVMETVERFLRCSGRVWKVTVAVRELGGGRSASGYKSSQYVAVPTGTGEVGYTNVPFTMWCCEILDVIRNAAVAEELSWARNTLSFVDDGEKAAGDEGAAVESALANDVQTNTLIVQPDSSTQLVVPLKENAERKLVVLAERAAGVAATELPYIAAQAKAAGVTVSDDAMYPLFRVLCTAARQKDVLPVSALVDLLLEEWTGDSVKWRRYSPTRLMCPLDSCGVPLDRSRVKRFLRPFLQVMRGAVSVGTESPTPLADDDAARTVNYAQFSMIMLAIAKM